MASGAIERTSFLDAVVARWEVSRLAVVPFSLTMLLVSPVFVTMVAIGLFAEEWSAVLGLALLIVWLMLVALDLGRGVWIMLHPHASARWLRAIRATVAREVIDDALAHLAARHGDSAAYRITCIDMVNAVQVAKATRRNAIQQAQGLRLDEAIRLH